MMLRSFLQILTLFFTVYLKSQNPEEWFYAGPGKTREQVKGFIKALYVDPDNHHFVLAGGGSGGLFMTENARAEIPKWMNISDSFNGPNFGVSDIVVIPNTNRQTIFISTSHQSGLPRAYGNGILKTTDGGLSWQKVGPESKEKYFMPLEGLVANRENYNEMIAYSFNEVFLTTNAWETFSVINLPVDKANRDISFCDVEFAPFEPGKFYVCTRYNNKAAAKIFQCTKYGKEVTDITPSDVKAYRIEAATVYSQKFKGKFYIAHGFQNCYVRYFNGTAFSGNLNREPVTNTFANAYWCFELSINQLDTNVVYLSLTETARSTDGGKTFKKLNHYNGHNTHADVRAMLLSKSTENGLSDELYIGNDGGVSFISEYEPPAWKSLNGEGLDANQFWGVSVLQSDTLLVAGGTQDNGGFIISSDTVVNTMYTCGDGYLAKVLDKESAVIQCNTPSMYYHNVRNGNTYYLNVPDKMYETKRPLVFRDTLLYVGYHDIWSISKNNLHKGKVQFTNVSKIAPVKLKEGQHNNSIRCMDIGGNNSAIVCYAQPNWQEENIGKIFFCSDFTTNEPVFADITKLLNHNGFEVCKWSEVYTVEIDPDNSHVFYFTARDPFNQSGHKVYRAEYLPDSSRCDLKEITFNLPPLGINKIKTDKFSGVTYLAMDDGVYYASLNEEPVNWKKLNAEQNKLPSVSVMDIDFNYASNSVYAATYGRGLWKTQLVSVLKSEKTVSKNLVQNEPMKIDGKLTIGRKKTIVISGKLIITTGSSIVLQKKSRMLIRKSAQIRDENNKPVLIQKFLQKSKKASLTVE